MSNLVFPVMNGLTYSIFKVPTWATRTQRAISGRELTVPDYVNPIWNFRLTFSILRDFAWNSITTELRQLMNFYNQVSGGYDTFLFDDISDDSVTDQAVGTGDGTTRAFQLVRTLYTSGFAEAIIAVNAITNVKLNGTPTGAYTLDSTTGIITFTVAPGAGVAITWTGTFYFRCRFMTDSQEFEEFLYQRWTTKDLRLKSVVL